MHQHIFMLAALLVSGNTQAAEEFDETIPAELARLAMRLEPGDGKVYADILDDFPAFALSDDLEVIGSVEWREGSQSVYLRTSRGLGDARNVVQQALEANGWRPLVYPGMPRPPSTGFKTEDFVPLPSMLCDDALGDISVNSQRSDQHTVVEISWRKAATASGSSCSDTLAGRGRRTIGDTFLSGLQVELPRLELPPEGSVGRPSGSIGDISTNGRQEVRTGTPMQIAWELPAVFDYFASQVDAQGWTSQGRWETSVVAGGSWARITGRGESLLGLLSVVRRNQGDYQLEFRIIATPRDGG